MDHNQFFIKNYGMASAKQLPPPPLLNAYKRRASFDIKRPNVVSICREDSKFIANIPFDNFSIEQTTFISQKSQKLAKKWILNDKYSI